MDKSWFMLPYKLKKITLEGSEVRFPEAFAELMIKNFTKRNDRVLDPFAGFGTTLLVAQRLGRIGVGIEFEEERADFIASKLMPPSEIIHGSAFDIAKLDFDYFDFSLTSPPYMRSFDSENPFTNYSKRGDYTQYLKDIRKIYAGIKKVMKRDAPIILEISNTFERGRPMTPLAWDVAKEISQILFFERDFVFCHTNGNMKSQKTNHSYCLLFLNK